MSGEVAEVEETQGGEADTAKAIEGRCRNFRVNDIQTIFKKIKMSDRGQYERREAYRPRDWPFDKKDRPLPPAMPDVRGEDDLLRAASVASPAASSHRRPPRHPPKCEVRNNLLQNGVSSPSSSSSSSSILPSSSFASSSHTVTRPRSPTSTTRAPKAMKREGKSERGKETDEGKKELRKGGGGGGGGSGGGGWWWCFVVVVVVVVESLCLRDTELLQRCQLYGQQ